MAFTTLGTTWCSCPRACDDKPVLTLIELQEWITKQLLHTTPHFIPLKCLFARNEFCWFNVSPFGRCSHLWIIPTVFLLHLYHFYNDFLNNRTWTVTRKSNFTPCTQCHHYISGLTFIPFLHTDTVYRLALCSHLAEQRGAERPVLSKCLFPVIMVNKAPIWPVLHCMYVMKHSVSPDTWHLTKLSVFLTAVNSELSSSHRPTSSDS